MQAASFANIKQEILAQLYLKLIVSFPALNSAAISLASPNLINPPYAIPNRNNKPPSLFPPSSWSSSLLSPPSSVSSAACQVAARDIEEDSIPLIKIMSPQDQPPQSIWGITILTNLDHSIKTSLRHARSVWKMAATFELNAGIPSTVNASRPG